MHPINNSVIDKDNSTLTFGIIDACQNTEHVNVDYIPRRIQIGVRFQPMGKNREAKGWSSVICARKSRHM